MASILNLLTMELNLSKTLTFLPERTDKFIFVVEAFVASTRKNINFFYKFTPLNILYILPMFEINGSKVYNIINKNIVINFI